MKSLYPDTFFSHIAQPYRQVTRTTLDGNPATLSTGKKKSTSVMNINILCLRSAQNEPMPGFNNDGDVTGLRFPTL